MCCGTKYYHLLSERERDRELELQVDTYSIIQIIYKTHFKKPRIFTNKRMKDIGPFYHKSTSSKITVTIFV